jgi:hypothetical protein
VFIGNGYKNCFYTTGDCFYLMNCAEQKYYNADHAWGAVTFWKNSALSRKFISEWLEWCLNEEVLLSQNKYMMNLPGFQSSRFTQGILTNLAVMYNIPILPNNHMAMFHHPAQAMPFTRR